MDIKDYFQSISVLRENVLSDNKLKVIHSHWIYVASFVWKDPVPMQSLVDVERKLGKKIPEDIAVFLTSVSNGGILYRDIEDAMTGYELYGIDEYFDKQEYWKQSFDYLWQPQFLPIGEITPENRPIIMDLDSPTEDKKSCRLIEGSVCDPVPYWVELSQSFYEWIDNLVTAQGARYWLWR